MKNWNRAFGRVVWLLLGAFVMLCGCDSGETALDQATGHRTVKQYDKSKEDIEKVTRQQTEKLKSIPDDEKDEGK